MPVVPQTLHHDLAAAPFRPSRVLAEFVSARQAQRQQTKASTEQAAALAQFRRMSGGTGQPRRKALDAAMSALPAPAFNLVSGQRSFSAAGTDRLTSGWMASNTGINADLEAALATLRARSRDWFMNTDVGARYGELVADNIVGCDPPRLQVRALLADGKTLDEAANSAVERAWAAWCKKPEITGMLDFGQVCRNVAVGTAREGEFLARHVVNRSFPHAYVIQLLDVDRIDTSQNASAVQPSGNTVRLGVETDSVGRRVAVWLTRHHPGDSAASLSGRAGTERVLAQNILHGFVQHRPEQVRGYPWTAAVLRRANMLARYEEYAMVAAKIGAAKMGFYTVDKDAVATGMSLEELKDATGELMQDVEAGMIEALPPGVGFESFDPDYPHQNYGPFVDQAKRDLAAGLSVAHHNLSGNMSGVNYSSARIAELSERRHWRALQRWLIASFVQPTFENWLRAALQAGAVRLESGAPLPAERFEKFAAAATFQPPGWAWVDPEADLKGAAIAVSYDMRSMRQIADENGIDLDDVLADKKRQMEQYTAHGLPIPPWMYGAGAVSATGGTPGQAPAPAPKPTPAPAPEPAQ